MPKQRNVAKPRSRANRSPAVPGTRVPLVKLPRKCVLPVPPMPEGRDWTPWQQRRWEDLWTGPQANAWDESAAGTVALLVTYEDAILSGAGSAWQATEARYAATALGLTPASMAALGWVIES